MAASTSTARPTTTSEAARHAGGIEALRLKVGPVRRNLFGPVDHKQLQQDFQRLLVMNVEVANKRWNFDFMGDVPGDGSGVEWEELRYQDVPAFYRSCMVRRQPAKKASRRASASSSGEGEASGSSSGSGDEYLEVAQKVCYRLQKPGKRTQSTITDFFKVKKRKLLHYKASSRQ